MVLGLLLAVYGSCAKVECQLNSDCGDHSRCERNVCVRDCVEDRDCPGGEYCEPNGRCIARDAGSTADREPPDLGVADSGVAPDVPMNTDTGSTAPDDTGVAVIADTGAISAADTGTVAPFDSGFDTGLRDTGVDLGFDTGLRDTGPRDSGASPDVQGPVGVGVYEFTGIRPGTLVSPVAAAWHPSGAWALVLSYTDEVHRYEAATGAIARVATAGRTVYWRAVTFAPDGGRALLLGNNISGSSRTGRLFVFDSAAATLTERSTEAWTSGSYEALRFAPDGSRGALLGRAAAFTSVWFVNAMGQRVGSPIARGMVAQTGCDDLAWVRDGFGDPALAVACGTNTGEIAAITSLDANPRFVTLASSGQTGNVHRVTSRPQGDMALAIGSSSNKIYRYTAGVWEAGFNSPVARASFGVAFNDNGTRAFAFGGFGYLTEFRYNLYTSAELTQSQIPLAMAPFTQPTGAQLNAVAWRPGCDEGLAVGGVNNVTQQGAFVAVFRAMNGRRCPNQ